jgi:hypothetical protein
MRVPHAWRPGRRMQEVLRFATIAYALLEMAGWFHRREVTRVVIEPTCDCVNRAYYLLRPTGSGCLPVNTPRCEECAGPAQNDTVDPIAAKIAERDVCWPLGHPEPIRELPDLTALSSRETSRTSIAGRDRCVDRRATPRIEDRQERGDHGDRRRSPTRPHHRGCSTRVKRVLSEYFVHDNTGRRHHGIDLEVPVPAPGGHIGVQRGAGVRDLLPECQPRGGQVVG